MQTEEQIIDYLINVADICLKKREEEIIRLSKAVGEYQQLIDNMRLSISDLNIEIGNVKKIRARLVEMKVKEL